MKLPLTSADQREQLSTVKQGCIFYQPYLQPFQRRYPDLLFKSCRSFYHAGVFDGALELFFNQLISSKPDGGLFDRFLIQSMLFHHAVLTCPSFKGTSSALQMSSAARSQVSRQGVSPRGMHFPCTCLPHFLSPWVMGLHAVALINDSDICRRVWSTPACMHEQVLHISTYTQCLHDQQHADKVQEMNGAIESMGVSGFSRGIKPTVRLTSSAAGTNVACSLTSSAMHNCMISLLYDCTKMLFVSLGITTCSSFLLAPHLGMISSSTRGACHHILMHMQADNVKEMSQHAQASLRNFWKAQRLHQLGQILANSFFTLTVRRDACYL